MSSVSVMIDLSEVELEDLIEELECRSTIYLNASYLSGRDTNLCTKINTALYRNEDTVGLTRELLTNFGFIVP